MKEKDKFDALTREYAKAAREFLCGNATYFTRMPNGFRVEYIEDVQGSDFPQWFFLNIWGRI